MPKLVQDASDTTRNPSNNPTYSANDLFEDPLDEDRYNDPVVVASRRGLIRLALIAVETGARFQREEIGHDALGWMLTRHRVFEGRTALDACLSRDQCLRALILHGLSLGVDVDPKEVDILIAEDETQPDEDHERLEAIVLPFKGNGDGRGRRLFTSVLVHESENGLFQSFGATVASSRLEATARMVGRHPMSVAKHAELREGFDASLPLVEALVSPALTDMLLQVAADPGSPLAEGLEIAIEQRFRY